MSLGIQTGIGIGQQLGIADSRRVGLFYAVVGIRQVHVIDVTMARRCAVGDVEAGIYDARSYLITLQCIYGIYHRVGVSIHLDIYRSGLGTHRRRTHHGQKQIKECFFHGHPN